MDNYEKLGAFYLGKGYDLAAGKVQDDLLLYDAKDLTTHAVCIGMTGSGKTGLCISLLEEAAIDGIPSIVIDPKGDLGNLLLTFPGLQASEFEPWVNPDDARRKDLSVAEYAQKQADLWRKGLAEWGQDGARIYRLREAAEFAIYTPGSEAGLPVSILSSFAAPPEEVRTDGDLLRERVSSTATGLLGLMGIDADPIRSREHILLSTILNHAWNAGQSLDLPALIRAIQSPPVERVGVFELDSFYPAEERFGLAMQLNNLLAAPGFQGWLAGHPMDIQRFLYTSEGRPRTAIFSIAHLSDAERMFFVSLLLTEFLGWMRGRPGTTSLRALLYMDEIFGFIPPIAEPPSKKPFLTLLKQARAFGCGVVLATQNPVDLDYKGLSNTGTWFIGRLQTERDKMRVLEGLEGAAAGGEFDGGRMEQVLAGLGKRVFLMHNVHEAGPTVFHTRWAMSYLRGPLTRNQIGRLMEDRKTAPSGVGAIPAPVGGAPRTEAPLKPAATRPVLPPSIPQVFLPAGFPGEGQLTYQPALLGLGKVRYVDRKSKKTKHVDEIALLLPFERDSIASDWQDAEAIDLCREDLDPDPVERAGFGNPPADAESARSYTRWKKELADTLYRSRSCDLFRSPALGLISEPGETEGDFRARLAHQTREKRDRLADALRKKYARRVARLEERIRKAEMAVAREKEQASSQKVQTALSFGATLLSAFLGRKKLGMGTLGRATTAARGVGRAAKEGRDVKRAQQNVQAYRQQLVDLNSELQAELDELEDRLDPLTEELETTSLRPRRSDVDVRMVALAWVPHEVGADGTMRRIVR